VNMQQAYRGVSWTTVFLVAGMIPMATAVTESGAGQDVAERIVSLVGDRSPTVLLLALFLITVVFGQLISNTATALVMIPIAVSAADQLDISARPVLMSLCVAAAVAFLGGDLTGRTAVVHGPGPWAGRLGPAWVAAGGGSVAEGDADADTEVLFVAGKAGVIDHGVAEGVRARLLVPLTPVPVTAKAYAVLSRAGTTFVPDALTLAAPLLAIADPTGGDPLERVRGVAAAMATHGVDAWRAMVERAESYLSTWQDALPYGRPLA